MYKFLIFNKQIDGLQLGYFWMFKLCYVQMFQDFPFLQPLLDFFLSIWVSFHGHSRVTGLQEKGEDISITLHYHFHLLYRHLDVSQAIAAESSPLHIVSSRTWSRNLWFPKGSKSPSTIFRIFYLTEYFGYETSLIKEESDNSYGGLVFFWGGSVNYLNLVVFYFKNQNISDKLFLDKFWPSFWTKSCIFHFLSKNFTEPRQVFIFMLSLVNALGLQIFCSPKFLQFSVFYWK